MSDNIKKKSSTVSWIFSIISFISFFTLSPFSLANIIMLICGLLILPPLVNKIQSKTNKFTNTLKWSMFVILLIIGANLLPSNSPAQNEIAISQDAITVDKKVSTTNYQKYSELTQNNQMILKIVVPSNISDLDCLSIYNSELEKYNTSFSIWFFSSEEKAESLNNYEIASATSINNEIIIDRLGSEVEKEKQAKILKEAEYKRIAEEQLKAEQDRLAKEEAEKKRIADEQLKAEQDKLAKEKVATEKNTTTKTTSTQSSTKSTSNSTTTTTPSASQNNEATVYKGETGTKYHKSTCRTLKNGAFPITLSEAKAEGRAACKVCKP